MSLITRVVLAALTLLAMMVSASADERILRFVSNVDVQATGDLLVSETIAIRAEGAVIKHGIVRDFPTTYTKPDGTEVDVRFDVTSVTRDDAPEAFAMEQMANGWRVRIGRADAFVTSGTHTYVIKYRTTRQLGFFKDFDELYWNATGNGWPFTIDRSEARINLPDADPFKPT